MEGPTGPVGRDTRRVLRPISGGGADDLELVISVLAGAAELCADCIAQKAGISRVNMPSVIARIGKTLRVETPDARCTGCLMTRAVYRLA